MKMPFTRRRSVPQRTTQTRSRLQDLPRTTSVERAKFQQQEQRNIQQFLQDVQKQSSEIFSQATNLNQLNTTYNQFLRENINQVPPQARSQFQATLKKEVDKIRAEQKNNLERYEQRRKDIQSFRRELRAEGKTSRELQNITEELRALNEITRALRNGNIINPERANQYIKDKVRQRQQLEQSVDRQIATREKLKQAQSFVLSESEAGRTPDIKEVRDKFGLTLSQARDISSPAITQRRVESLAQESFERRELPSLQELTGLGVSEEQAKSIQENIKTAIAESRPAQEVITQFSNKFLESIKDQDIKGNISKLSDLEKLTGKGVSKADIDRWNNLSSRDREIIKSFVSITEARDIAKSSEFDAIKEQDEFFKQGDKLYEILRRDLKYVNLPPQKEVRVAFTEEDKKNINFLVNLTDAEIFKKINEGKFDRINASANSINSVFQRAEESEKFFIKDMIRQLERETKPDKLGLKTLVNSFPLIAGVKAIKDLTLLALRKELQEIQKKGGTITVQEYKNYNKIIDDVFGIKEISKKTANQLRTEFKGSNNVKDFAKSLWNVRTGLMDFAIRGGEVTIEILKSLWTSVANFAKLPFQFTEQTYKAMLRDTVDILQGNIKKSDKLFEQTKKETEKFKKAWENTKSLTNMVKENPEVLVIGLAMLVSAGVKGLRNAVVNNPEKVLAQIASFVVVGQILKVPKLIKKQFSPFVLRNVKVITDDATLKGTAQAIKALQGKKIDLFNATPTSLKSIFKDFGLSKQAEEMLIRNMLKNPSAYIGSNLQIKPLSTIIKSSTQGHILEYLKLKGGFLSGSGALKLQLSKFRKIGDYDIVARNASAYAKSLANYLNSKTLLGRLTKIKRYVVVKHRKIDGVFIIKDKLTGKNIVDVDDLRLVQQNFKFLTGKTLTPADLRTIEGVKVLKVERQLAMKLRVSRDITAGRRADKELQDVKAILGNIKQKIQRGEYDKVNQLLKKQPNILRVDGSKAVKGMGVDRKFWWAEKYGINIQGKKTSAIIRELKKRGFSNAQINQNIRLYSPDGMYFAPDMIYQYFLKGKQGGIIMIKDYKIDKLPKAINALLKKNLAGQLSRSQQLQLRRKLVQYAKKNPDKIFVGEKALADRFGEVEVIAPAYTRLFPKKTLIKREVYIPLIDDFVQVQQVVVGKQPLSLLQRMAKAFIPKLKKGYSVKQMKKDVIAWAKKNIKNFKEALVGKPTSERQAIKKFLDTQRKLLDDQISTIKKSKQLTATQKKNLIKNLTEQRKRITPNRVVRYGKRNIVQGVNRVLRNLRSVKRATPRVARGVARKVTPRATPRVPVRPRATPRVPVRPRGVQRATSRPVVRPPRRARTIRNVRFPKAPPKAPPKPLPKPLPQLTSKTKLKRGQRFMFNGLINVHGEMVELPLNTTLNRAFNYMSNLVDNTISSRFELKIAGVTSQKDIQPIGLSKFKVSQSPRTLRFVEKQRHLKDTRGERIGLTVGKVLKRDKKRK